MIERAAAVRAVEAQLERDYQHSRAMSVDTVRTPVVHVEEHELVWIVSWQSGELARTRNSKHMLIGNGPYLVDRVDGGLHQIHVVPAQTEEWEDDYRARIRGLPVRTAVDDLHDALRGVAATRGRMHAVRTLHLRLSALSPAEAIEYVSALLTGDPPARLVAVAIKELVEPLDPVLAAETILSGAAIRTGRGPEERRKIQPLCLPRIWSRLSDMAKKTSAPPSQGWCIHSMQVSVMTIPTPARLHHRGLRAGGSLSPLGPEDCAMAGMAWRGSPPRPASDFNPARAAIAHGAPPGHRAGLHLLHACALRQRHRQNPGARR
ncbi:YrhB domain-containing protein [Streptomyces sp. SID14446]|uniref:YrhB domain-containing protein n=1 Tax=Streptomyces sp. SID14446 TaxID=2706072 RepID=UPI0031BAAB69